MKKIFKYLIYLSFLFYVGADFEDILLKNLNSDDPAVAAPKINWNPILQDQAEYKSNPFYTSLISEESEEYLRTKPKINWRPILQDLAEHESNSFFRNLLSKESAANKNWRPRLQDQIENESNSFVHSRLSSEQSAKLQTNATNIYNVTSAIEEPANADCTASSERGINGLIKQVRPLLPIERLRNIIANAAYDPEIRNLYQILHSESFHDKLACLRATDEKRMVRDYSCRHLNLDLSHCIEYIHYFFNLNVEQAPITSMPNRRAGIRGLLLNLHNALPRQQLHELYQRAVASDSELTISVQRIKSLEFRQLLRNYRNRIEYREIRDILERAAVPLDGILHLVTTILGLQNIDLGVELAIF